MTIKSTKSIIIEKIFFISLILLLTTISAGALVSGTDAGLAYNNFPFMGDNILPPILTSGETIMLKIFVMTKGSFNFTQSFSYGNNFIVLLIQFSKLKEMGFLMT